jgi:hypothetical protein
VDPFTEPKIPESRGSLDSSKATLVVEKKVEETKTVMSENIDKLKERGETLERARDTSEDLKNTSTGMMTNLEKLRKANENKTFW